MPGHELPIACFLDAAGLRARKAELASLGRSLISVSEPKGGPAVLRFTPDEGTRTVLDHVVAAEAECCPFLDLRIAEGDPLELTIDGPADAAPVIADLVSAFRGEPVA
jgi:hypothetical protein